MSSNEIFALRKQGNFAEALEMARGEYSENSGDIWFLRAYAWALYDHVKKLVDAHEVKDLSAASLNSKLTPYIREFARFSDRLRKDSAFSQMIYLTVKASRDWESFLGFARWAGIDDFPDKDKASFVNDQGKTIDSLQKRFTRAVCRETVNKATDSQADDKLIEWGTDILEHALEAEPNDLWLNYYRSKLHLIRGEVELAIKRLTPVLSRQSKVAWPWALLGEILEASRPGDALTCHAHATQLAREEQEVAKVRIHLAQRLSMAGRFNEAALQANSALAYREEHGFKVPQDLAQLLASEWYRQAEADGSMQQLPSAEVAANTLLQELNRRNLAYTTGVIEHINTEKSLSYVATGTQTGVGLLHSKFPQIANLEPGTLVEVGRSEADGPARDWRLSQATSLLGLCEKFAGSLERHNGKDFAFIRTPRDDVFVPPVFAKAYAPGQQYDVLCLAIKRTDKKGKIGWRAVKVSEQGRS